MLKLPFLASGLLLMSINSFANTSKLNLKCEINSYMTASNNKELAVLEKDLRAEIKIAFDSERKLGKIHQKNSFKFINSKAGDESRFDYLKTYQNDSGDLVLKNVPMQSEFDDDEYSYSYSLEKKGVTLFITTKDFKSLTVHILKPDTLIQNDYYIALDCHE